MGIAIFWIIFSLWVGWHAHDLGKNGWVCCWAAVLFSPMLMIIVLYITKNSKYCMKIKI